MSRWLERRGMSNVLVRSVSCLLFHHDLTLSAGRAERNRTERPVAAGSLAIYPYSTGTYGASWWANGGEPERTANVADRER